MARRWAKTAHGERIAAAFCITALTSLRHVALASQQKAGIGRLMADWKRIEIPAGTWSRVESEPSGWSPVSDGDSCGDWVGVDADGDCLDWDSPNRVCWILGDGYWRDTCFWRDLSLWNDGQEPWSQAA